MRCAALQKGERLAGLGRDKRAPFSSLSCFVSVSPARRVIPTRVSFPIGRVYPRFSVLSPVVACATRVRSMPVRSPIPDSIGFVNAPRGIEITILQGSWYQMYIHSPEILALTNTTGQLLTSAPAVRPSTNDAARSKLLHRALPLHPRRPFARPSAEESPNHLSATTTRSPQLCHSCSPRCTIG